MGSRSRIPLEKRWFDKSLDDMVYGVMAAVAASEKKDGVYETKLTKKDFKENLPLLLQAAGGCKREYLMTRISRLVEAGYIVEKEFYYLFPYNEINRYVLLNKELIKLLGSHFTTPYLKIYVFLLGKYKCKDYYFTLREMKTYFGYNSKSAKINEEIKTCLAILSLIGVFKYSIEWVNVRGQVTSKFKIEEVVEGVPDRVREELSKMDPKKISKEVQNFLLNK